MPHIAAPTEAPEALSGLWEFGLIINIDNVHTWTAVEEKECVAPAATVDGPNGPNEIQWHSLPPFLLVVRSVASE